jgi:FtsH-binding integral membrane protein
MATFDSLLKSFQFGKLEKPVKTHLRNVYTTMGVALLSCAVGGYIQVFTAISLAGLLTTLGSVALVMWLVMTPDSPANRNFRIGLLMTFAFLSGVNIGPYIDHVIDVDPSIVPTAFLATSLIFVCFSLCALLSDDRKFLALGGTLMSALSWMMLLAVLNIFTGSRLLYQVHVYLGLAVMCGFVLFDTQAIVEKRRQGSDDFVTHTLDLFIDFLAIFRRLLVILSDNAKKEKRRN